MSNFEELFYNNKNILMEAALAERLKRKYGIKINEDVALASIIYNKERVLNSNYNENIIEDNVTFLKEIRASYKNNIFIGGLMGCYSDAYRADDGLNIKDSIMAS